jgi:hypothetical protein
MYVLGKVERPQPVYVIAEIENTVYIFSHPFFVKKHIINNSEESALLMTKYKNEWAGINFIDD